MLSKNNNYYFLLYGRQDSNLRNPPDPKSGVLPTELLPYLYRIMEEEVGFQPTRRDDYRPNGFQVRPLQALEYSSIFVENIRIELISADS